MMVLSIDPGKTCGLAVLRLAGPDDTRLWATASEDFAHVYEHVLSSSHSAQTDRGPRPILYCIPGGSCAIDAVVIEDTRSQPIHAKRRGKGSNVSAKIARDVGRIDAMIDLLEHRARCLCLPVLMVEPTGQKWDHALYKRITGAKAGRSNQHERDAVRNAWGLTPRHIEALTHSPG